MERDGDGFLIMEEPAPVSTRFDGREWSLEVPQQPIRARMCGFGDKVCVSQIGNGLIKTLTEISGPKTDYSSALCQIDSARSDYW